MTTQDTVSKGSLFKSNFSSLKDPRRITKGNLIYSLEELLFLAISAVINGCDTFKSRQCSFLLGYGRSLKYLKNLQVCHLPQTYEI
jgi:hypothetical protein